MKCACLVADRDRDLDVGGPLTSEREARPRKPNCSSIEEKKRGSEERYRLSHTRSSTEKVRVLYRKARMSNTCRYVANCDTVQDTDEKGTQV